MAKSKKSPNPSKKMSDDEWIAEHLQELVDKYGGQYLVVAEGEAFIGYDVVELERKAKAKHPNAVTTGMPIPRPEDFVSLL